MPRRCRLLVLTVVCLGPAAPHAGAQHAAEAVAPPAAVPAAADQTPLLTTGAQTRRLQRALGVRADGMLGRRSRAALRRWEGREGLLADGLPDPETLGRLGIDLTPAQIARVAPPPAAPAGGVLYAAGPPRLTAARRPAPPSRYPARLLHGALRAHPEGCQSG